MNRCIFSGRMTADPELKETRDGKSFCKFSLAVTKKIGDKKETSFLNFTVWGGLSNVVAQYFKKGKPIVVEARAKQERWEDASGKRQSMISFVVENFEFVDGGNSNENREDGESMEDYGVGY